MGLTSTYTNTINQQTQRIADAHEIIQAKALEMQLKIQKGEGDAKPTSATTLRDNHKIMDTASAINSIQVNVDPGTKTIDGTNSTIQGNSIYIDADFAMPNSFYTLGGMNMHVAGNINIDTGATSALTFTGEHTAGAGSITVSTSGANITKNGYLTIGENATASKTIILKENSKGSEKSPSNLTIEDYTAVDSKKYVSIIPEQGYYTKDAWKTDISYAPLTGEQTIEVVEDTATGETAVKTLSIPAGYYPEALTVKPLIKNIAGDHVINVLGTIPTLTAQSGNIAIANGYNYYSGTSEYSVQKATTASGTQTSPSLNSVNANGTFTIKTPGWIPAGTYGAAYGNLGALAKTDITKASSTGTADDTLTTQKSVITVAENKQTSGGAVSKIYQVQDVSLGKAGASGAKAMGTTTSIQNVNGTNKLGLRFNSTTGYTNSGWYDLGTDVFISDINYQGNKTEVNPTFDGRTASISYTVPAGYYPGTTTITGSTTMTAAATPTLTVTANSTDAVSVGTTATNGFFPVSAVITGQTTYGTAGYITTAGLAAATAESTVIGKIAAGSHNIDSTIYQNTKSVTDNGVGAGNYYIKCETSPGYQLKSTTYVDLGKSVVSPGTITYSNGTFIGSVSTNQGYTPGQKNVALSAMEVTEGSGNVLLTTATTSKSIGPNTYYPSTSTISVSSANVRIAGAGTATGKTTNSGVVETTILGNLTGDTDFVASDNKFINKVTVVVSDIISALAAI